MSIQGCGSGVDAGIGEAVRGRCRNRGSSECQYKGVDQG